SAQFLKEVAVDGQTIGAQNVRQDLGEGAFGARHRVGAAPLSHCTFGGSGLSLLGKCVFHRVLHGPLTSVREELRYSIVRRAYPYRRMAAPPNIGGLLAQAGPS